MDRTKMLIMHREEGGTFCPLYEATIDVSRIIAVSHVLVFF